MAEIITTNYIEDQDGNLHKLIPVVASANTVGGIKAKKRTTENNEVVVDDDGNAYVAGGNIESISVNGTVILPDDKHNVDITVPKQTLSYDASDECICLPWNIK